MATSVRLIRRYVWLVDTIRRAGSITLEDINRKWAYNTLLNIDQEDEIPERTFHRHREAIAELFDIDIRCNRYDGNKYYIENDESLDKPSFTSWLFNGLSIDNQMMENRDVAERIIFEEIPGGTAFIAPIIEAIIKHKMLSVEYKRFNSNEIKKWIVAPTLLKQSNRRWYLIANIDGQNSNTTFALDRIESAKLLDTEFIYEYNINEVKTKFDEVVGVNIDEDFDCEKVVVRVYGKQRSYIDTLPLHSSQRVKEVGKGYTDYEYTIRPEYEFQHEILRLGANAEVLTPTWLREEIKWQAEEIVKQYNQIK